MSKNKSSLLIPLIAAVCVLIGVFIGVKYSPNRNNVYVNQGSTNKLNYILRIIDENYVDTLNMTELVEDALPTIISNLDPHSVYIPKTISDEVFSDLQASFSGVGIQFTIQQDTIYVNSVVKQGPSEEAGIIAGDRIVMVDDSLFVGKSVNNRTAMKKLKGPKGSKVKLGIKRQGETDILAFDITRGDIPQNTIDATYMIDNKFGYIQLAKFGRTSYVELINSMARLLYEKCEGVIIDLRGNSGGYLDIVAKIVNEFLPKDQLILFTEGAHMSRQNIYTTGSGGYQDIPVILLIDEESASSSEIFAAAIQDNDRGTIIGRRSYGKGLVQKDVEFNDSTALRLTIARYYTPSGRSIQRPYTKGNNKDYGLDLYYRIQHGELFTADSIKLDKSKVYHTANGRPIYGGGGIMPDIFVPHDTIGSSSYLTEVLSRGLTIQFAFQYSDRNRDKLSQFKNESEMEKYLLSQHILERFVQFAQSKGIKRRNILINKSKNLLEKNLVGNIIYNILGMEEHVKYINKTDKTMQTALDVLKKGDSFPKPPLKTDNDEANSTTQKGD